MLIVFVYGPDSDFRRSNINKSDRTVVSSNFIPRYGSVCYLPFIVVIQFTNPSRFDKLEDNRMTYFKMK